MLLHGDRRQEGSPIAGDPMEATQVAGINPEKRTGSSNLITGVTSGIREPDHRCYAFWRVRRIEGLSIPVNAPGEYTQPETVRILKPMASTMSLISRRVYALTVMV